MQKIFADDKFCKRVAPVSIDGKYPLDKNSKYGIIYAERDFRFDLHGKIRTYYGGNCKMKRFLAILMVLALALCCLAACGKNDDEGGAKDSDNDLAPGTDPAYESQVEVEGGTLELQTAVDGETLYVSVVMSGNPGFAGFSLTLEFDNTKCVAKEITGSDILDYEAITSNLQQELPEYTYVSAMWASPSDVTGDGVLFTVAFDITDAEAEDYGLNLVCPKDAFSNEKFEAVLFTVK